MITAGVFTMLVSQLLSAQAHVMSMAEVLEHGHSHNDYEQKRPLDEALMQGFSSVEADIWFRRGDLWISHSGLPWQWKGTLRALYLDRIQKLVDERGSVYGDGRPFVLWLDIKEGSSHLREELRRQLARYPMLSVFSEDGDQERPVIAILTGNEAAKTRYVDEERACRAIRDSTSYHPGDNRADAKWRWYALNWSKVIKWDGHGEPQAREKKRLLSLVRRVHEKGRRLRLWKLPASREAWRLSLEAGVDQLGVDDLAAYHEFAASYGED